MTVYELRGQNVQRGFEGLLKFYYSDEESDYAVIISKADEEALRLLLEHRARVNAKRHCDECTSSLPASGEVVSYNGYSFCSNRCAGAFVGIDCL